MTSIESKILKVKIDGGELVSVIKNKREYMHQKNAPGWGHSDTEMFPLIGPTEKAEFKVKTPNGIAVQDQHGLLRELKYELVDSTKTSATFKKEYQANTKVKNSKFNSKQKTAINGTAHPEYLYWPYNFTFLKTFTLEEDALEISFTISGDKNMPYMLGYHPAFKLESKNPIIETPKCKVDLEEVMAVGSRALSVLNASEITLNDDQEVTLKTEGFKHFMLWTEVENMVCMEPITFYPYAVNQKDIDSGFQKLGSKPDIFKVKLLF
ncbi:MAG: aldose 1-epimerase [Leeuwenhoekiella sp.]